MDEYYCPNYGAILNDQYGFDPEKSTWRCTECGQILMDDDTYDGDRFEGIAWHCDSCGALLNSQDGFSDEYDQWECEKCHYINCISENNIFYDFDEEDNNEYYCPNCGAILNDQYGFDPDNSTWECTECGQILMDEDTYEGDRFEGIAWHCDSCGALLNSQNGFSDEYDEWECENCYHINYINEDNISEDYYDDNNYDEYEEDDEDYNEYEEDDDCDEYEEENNDYDDYDEEDDDYDEYEEDDDYDDYDEYEEENNGYDDYDEDDYSENKYNEENNDNKRINNVKNSSNSQNRYKYNKNEFAEQINNITQKLKIILTAKRVIYGFIIIFLLTVFISIYSLIKYREGKIQVPIDSNVQSINVTYEYVENILKTKGFNNIILQADSSGWKEENMVVDIIINDDNRFSKGAYFDPNSTIIIKYSSKNRVDISNILGNWRYENYTDLIANLKKHGFTNINIQEKDTFNMEENMKVSSVTLNSIEYNSGQCYIPKSAPIDIVYYTLKITIGNENVSFVGQDYLNVVENLKNIGFINVTTEEIYTGWNRGNSVISVMVNNKLEYNENDVFYPNVRINVKYSSNDNRIDITKELYNWNNAKYDALKNILNIKGFKNIKLEAIDTFDSNLNEKVSSITINGEDYIGGECHLQKTASIILKHYILKLKFMAKDSDIRGKQYKEIVDKLKEIGFTNITLYRSDDLVNGWINKEGAIKSISIDGNEKFTENDMFNFNAEIKIVVNTFRDKEYEDQMLKLN